VRRRVEPVLQPHHGAVEAAALVVLYGLYELTIAAWGVARALLNAPSARRFPVAV
jgi:hypothetical protein